MRSSGSTSVFLRAGFVGALTLMLVACGGGGGDSGGSASVLVNVTAANQDQLARAAAVAVQGGMFGDSLSIADGGQNVASSRDRPLALTAPSVASQSLPALARRVAERALAPTWTAESARESAAAVLGPEVEPCALSGSTSTSLDDSDGNGMLSVGERITVVFNACRDSAEEAIDGTMKVTVTRLVAFPLAFDADASMTDFRLDGADFDATYDGSFDLSFAQPSASVTSIGIAVVSRLVVQVVTPQFSDTVTLRAGFVVDSTYDDSLVPPGGGLVAGRTLTTASGPVGSEVVGGHVLIETLEPVIQYDVDAYPRSGVIAITGNVGALRGTVLSTTEVRMDLDADGDNSFEATKTVAWNLLL